ncbi:Protein of unknown function [Gryllus bimaculatus]|nr:Protein of unknown function [Gryllus bimaculatus]
MLLAMTNPLFGPSEVTPTTAMGVIGSSAVEHAATAMQQMLILAISLYFWTVQEAILGDESAAFGVVSARYSSAF